MKRQQQLDTTGTITATRSVGGDRHAEVMGMVVAPVARVTSPLECLRRRRTTRRGSVVGAKDREAAGIGAPAEAAEAAETLAVLTKEDGGEPPGRDGPPEPPVNAAAPTEGRSAT